MNNTFSLLGVF